MIRNDYNNIVLFYIAAFATSMAWVLVFIWLGDKKRFLKLTAPVREVGRYTLPYIAFQVALMRILRYYIPLFGAENELSRILVSVFVFFCFYPAARLIQIYLLPKGKWLHTHPARHRGERLRHAGH